MYQDHHYSTAKSIKSSNNKQFIMSVDAKCNFSSCTCSYHATVHSNSELIITFKGKIVHSPSEQRARPIRGTHRLSVAEKLTSGLSPDQLRLKEQGHLTENNRKFGNHNLVDSSPHILQKIKEEQAKLINVGKRVPGYLQTITISPLRLILFTEGALILWNKIGSNVPISWDATGRIVMSRGKRVYYYELTVTNIASRSVTTKNLSGPSFPITSMLSSTHTTMDLVRWLQELEAAY
ncbi:unnamed protein product [Rotaria socialis]|uniref:Uncharacterized protein n=1 Tax=Rotaria socialis TaxID=392032 RepID=A0A821ZQY1_9BILA|nr:unnamed protein product [Rotaria socialis]